MVPVYREAGQSGSGLRHAPLLPSWAPSGAGRC